MFSRLHVDFKWNKDFLSNLERVIDQPESLQYLNDQARSMHRRILAITPEAGKYPRRANSSPLTQVLQISKVKKGRFSHKGRSYQSRLIELKYNTREKGKHVALAGWRRVKGKRINFIYSKPNAKPLPIQEIAWRKGAVKVFSQGYRPVFYKILRRLDAKS